jgi:hypothetical protein
VREAIVIPSMERPRAIVVVGGFGAAVTVFLVARNGG